MWKVLEASRIWLYPKAVHRFTIAERERVGKNEAGEAGGDQKMKSLDAELRNLDHPMKNVEPQ